ncbi:MULTISPECIES: glutaredoxin family protein [Sutcliffiella]|uniref:Glutaredoxin n=1 Tax=Sutcliffiella cohnii TaxID=33932 RepID=A0A223KUT1_9BACI|nr:MULTISPECIES: glutaredoxin family protein [Sutcliffiella]AST93251.1 glutaredoxin [Sutcliffiella cohnii]WBL14432.1 glutaredoxin family protein [Sutcliffiella sp. NC1]
MKVTLYSKENCSLCDKGKKILEELQEEIKFSIEEVDIYKDDMLLEKYQIMIPVAEVDGDMLGYGIFNKVDIRNRLLEKIS